MNLDPALAALAAAAIAPTKFLVDLIANGYPRTPARTKPLIAYVVGFALIVLYQLYAWQDANVGQRIAGDLLAAIGTLTGAVVLTETHKMVERKKTEQRAL